MLKNLFKANAGSKVDSAQKKAKSALGMFAKASVKLDKANDQLEKMVQDAQSEANILLIEIERAVAEQKANKAVQEKLKDFIPQV